MTPRGRGPFGDETGDAEEPGHGHEGARGWIPPEERVWRHPSELARSSPSAGPGQPPASGRPGPARIPSGGHDGRRPLTTIGVGVGAAAAVVTGIVLLVSTGLGQTPPSSTTTGRPPLLTATQGCCRSVPATAAGTQQALVSLRVAGPGGTRQACGIAFAAGGLVVTTADVLSAGGAIQVLSGHGGWSRASVVGTDPTADVAVLKIGSNLPTAHFGDDANLTSAAATVVMADAPRQGSTGVATMWAAAGVRSVATAISSGTGRGLAAITAASSPVPPMAGEALVDAGGTVVGLLDVGAATAGQEVFLPGRFVVDVADQLLQAGHVTHGWLDVALANATSGVTVTTAAVPGRPQRGAQVLAVMPHGASAGILAPGDVIVAVNGQPVRSMAELRSRLYVMPAGRSVTLDIWRASNPTSVDISLAPSP